MTDLDALIVAVAKESAQPAHRPLIDQLLDADERTRIAAASALCSVAALAGSAAHVMAMLLPTAPRRTAAAFREALAVVGPFLLKDRVAADAVHASTLLWLLNHAQADVHPRTIAVLAALAAPGDDVFDIRNFGSELDRLRCVAYVVAARICPSVRLIIVHAFLKSAAPVAIDAGFRVLLSAPTDLLAFARERIEKVSPLAVPRLLEMIAAHDRAGLLKTLTWAAKLPEHTVRQAAAELLARECRPNELAVLRQLCADKHSRVRLTAIGALLRVAPHEGAERLRACLRDRKRELRLGAIELIADRGLVEHADAVAAAARSGDTECRHKALETAVSLAPERITEWVAPLLTQTAGVSPDVVVTALERAADAFDLPGFVLEQLSGAMSGAAPRLLDVAWKRAPERRRELVAAATQARSSEVRVALVELALDLDEPARRRLLDRLMRDRHADVRLAARTALRQAYPEQRVEQALASLRDPSVSNRLDAVRALCEIDESWLVDELLPRTRDPAGQVRAEALAALQKFDDPRIFSELVSALNDVDPNVVQLATEILNGEHGPAPVLDRFPPTPTGEPRWAPIRRRVEEINRWAARVGAELLGGRVVVHQYREGLGRTWNKKRHEAAHIEVSDTPVTSGHPHGEEIMKGLALHEIGHHIYDIGTRGNLSTRGIAQSEGVRELYDILRDERLERGLRARRPAWGVYFDRLASYAFAQDINRVPLPSYASVLEKPLAEIAARIGRGELPGRVVPSPRPGQPPDVLLRESEMLQIPGLVPPLVAFLACLRCGFDPHMCPDPRIAEAITLVPSNLKDLGHAAVLDIARRIAKLLGTSPQHARDLESLRSRLRRSRGAFRALQRILDRLANTTHLADWNPDEGAGIRIHATSSGVSPGNAAKPRPSPGRGGQHINRGRELGFDELKKDERLVYDAAAHASLTSPIRKHIRRLRSYLERLGRREVEQYAARRGRRVDLAAARKSPILPRPNMLVYAEEQHHPDAYIGILIDRSGSMNGPKLELAKSFGALVAESAGGLPGIAGHVSAFDGTTFYDLGPFRRNAIAALTAENGNNDAGGLSRAADLAHASSKRHKLLVMISDGSPTECTFASLKKLVERLSREQGIICAQVAVQSLSEIAFPHYIDLSGQTLDAAVAHFGRLLMKLTVGWR